MLVEDIMTPIEKVCILEPMSTVREALKLMDKNGVKSIVIDKTSPSGAYGILTYKNILQSIVAEDGDIDLLNAYDIANIPALSISRKIDVKYAAKLMVQSSIKRLLVIDNNELYGILTMNDIIKVLIEDIKK